MNRLLQLTVILALIQVTVGAQVLLPHRHPVGGKICYCTSPYPQVAPTQTLLLRYAMKEESGDFLWDSSGNANTGIANNATWIRDVCGSNFGLRFDGASNFLHTAFALNPGTNILTACLWLAVHGFPATNVLTLESSRDYNLYNNAFAFNSDSVDSLPGIGIHQSSSKYLGQCFSQWTVNDWVHLGLVYDNSTTNAVVKVYLNGLLQTLNNCGTQGHDTAGNFNSYTIFLMSRGGTNYFTYGTLGDFRIYTGELTSNQVSYVMCNWGEPELNPNPTPGVWPVVTNGLVSSWYLEEASGPRADSYGSNTLQSSNTVGQVAGVVGNGASFANASNRYLAGSALASGYSNWTFAAWIKLSGKGSAGQSRRIASQWLGANNFGWIVTYERTPDRYIFYQSPAGNNFVSVTANNYGSPSLNEWVWICARKDSSTSKIYLSVNNGTEDNASSTNFFNSTRPLVIGALEGEATMAWDGAMDEVQIWYRSLSSLERAVVYNGSVGRHVPF